MNSEVSADVNFLADLPVRSLMALEDKRRRAKSALEAAAATFREAAPLFVALEALDIDIHVDLNSAIVPIDVRFAGAGAKLGAVWGLLRRAGYSTAQRPKKGDTDFNAIWCHARLAPLYVAFASTMCRRVQVGTQTVEQPLYEVQCEPLPELVDDAESDSTSLEALA